ncbi:MAG: lipase family protein [Rickettsiales bacterium]|nr:lipase family protein [Rickettsiales bacterium]
MENKYQAGLVQKGIESGRFTTDGSPPPDMNLHRALVCAELSDICYRDNKSWNPIESSNKASWEKECKKIERYAKVYGYHAHVFSSASQQAVVFFNDHNVIVAFEGSNPWQLRHYNRNLTSYFAAWFEPVAEIFSKRGRQVEREALEAKKNDMPAEQYEADLEALKDKEARIHWGFNSALDGVVVSGEGNSLWDAIKKDCLDLAKTRNLTFTGHSSGGALATIAASRMISEEPNVPIDGLYTFGQPRVGNRYFRSGLEHHLHGHYYRFDQYGDPMPGLPPFNPDLSLHNEKGYVHAGQWIPMDMDGHVLKMKDDEGHVIKASNTEEPKDTMHYANEEGSGIIWRAYSYLTNQLVQMADKYSVTAEMFSHIDDTAAGTHTRLSGLFGPKNYSIHDTRNYGTAIHLMIAHQAEDMSFDSAVALNETLQSSQGRNILYHLQVLEDTLQERATALPQGVRAAADTLQASLTSQLNRWDKLAENRPEQIFPQRSKRAVEVPDTPDAPDHGTFGRLFVFFSGFFSEKELEASIEDVRREPAFRSARSVRSVERVKIMKNIGSALNQFNHDVTQQASMHPDNWLLQSLAQQAEGCYESVAQFQPYPAHLDAAHTSDHQHSDHHRIADIPSSEIIGGR